MCQWRITRARTNTFEYMRDKQIKRVPAASGIYYAGGPSAGHVKLSAAWRFFSLLLFISGQGQHKNQAPESASPKFQVIVAGRFLRAGHVCLILFYTESSHVLLA